MHEGAVVEGSRRERQQEKRDANHAQDEAAPLQTGLEGNIRMAHGGDHEEQAPENPADPIDSAGQEKREWQADGKDAMYARRNGVENVAAVQLSAGNQVKRSRSEEHTSELQ